MGPSSKRIVRVAFCAVAVALLLPVLLSACPLCKEANPNAGSGMWRGMYWSILLMVSMPFAAAATMIVLVVRARRRHPRGTQP